jgi:hypothetical protein
VLAFLHRGAGREEEEFLVSLPAQCRVDRIKCDVGPLAAEQAAEIHRKNEERLASMRGRKGEHQAAIDLKAVPGISAEIVLTVDGELRKTRLFRSHEQAELVGAIADTRAASRRRAGRDTWMTLSAPS